MQRITNKTKVSLDGQGRRVVRGNVIYDDKQTRALLIIRPYRSYWWRLCKHERLTRHLRRLRRPIVFVAFIKRSNEAVHGQNNLNDTRLVHLVKGAQHGMTSHKELQGGPHKRLRMVAGPFDHYRQRIRRNVRVQQVQQKKVLLECGSR